MSDDLPRMHDGLFPRTFRVSDDEATKAQRGHLRLVKAYIGLGLVGASLAQMLYGLSDTLAKPPLSWPIPVKLWLVPLGFCVMVTLLVRFVLGKRDWERRWCKSRATAEEVRSLTWCYMMEVDPRNPAARDERPPAKAREQFINEIDLIKKDWVAVVPHVATHRADLPEITGQMDAVRALPYGRKIAQYVRHRIQSQIDWFEARARQGARSQQWFMIAGRVFEVGAAVFALLLILEVCTSFQLPISFRPSWTTFVWPCLTGAASVLAWTGYKRYQELSLTYGKQAEELISLKQQLVELTAKDTPEDWPRLVRLVRACEDMLTRETRTWFARRGL
jgi:hypothetical protein